MKRVIISDIHIGSKYYKGEELSRFLKEVEYDQLILAGDIIDFIRVPTFTARAIEIAEAIDYNKEIIYIVGNHDSPLAGFIGKELFGIKFVSKYEFQDGGKKYRVEHGDSYDSNSLVHNGTFMNILSVFQSAIEHFFDVNLGDWYTEFKIKRRKLRRIWDILNINSDVDVFIIGHSHVPECVIWVIPDGEVKSYLNCGDWVSNKTYITIENGISRLKRYHE